MQYLWFIYKWHTTSSDVEENKEGSHWNSSMKSVDFTACTRHSSLKQSTLYIGEIKKLKICSRLYNNMLCLCSNAQLHTEFLLCTFFLTCLILVKHLISLKSFIYWVIKLNAFNFINPSNKLNKTKIITRWMHLSVLCFKSQAFVIQSPFYATPPPPPHTPH